jgi:hypothetical protein
MHAMERKAAAHRLTVARRDMVAAEAIESVLQDKYARFTRKIQSVQMLSKSNLANRREERV